MIPKIVHLTTKDGRLNGDETIIMNKNKKIFHDWNFRVYSDTDNLQIITEKFPEFLEKYERIKRGVMKADIIRCLYLFLYGGLYIDTDYQFFKMIPQEWLEAKCVIPTEHFDDGDVPFLGNCIFFSEKGYPFWYDYVKYLFDKMDMTDTKEEDIIGCTGPGGITAFYLKNKDKYPELRYTPKNVFHPLIVNHQLGVRKTQETVGAHYCFGAWRGKSHSPIRKWIYTTIQHIQAIGWNKLNF